jgi:hypothetical protein
LSLTATQLRASLSYDPEAGHFEWLTGQRRGQVAGCVDPTTGYCRIVIAGRPYAAHRLAWLYETGEWPADQIDHRNTVRSDNRWANLRAATASQNKSNCERYSNNKSGFKGVSYSGSAYKNKPWTAAITKDGATRRIGRFATKEEAAMAYAQAATRAHGEFARVGV